MKPVPQLMCMVGSTTMKNQRSRQLSERSPMKASQSTSSTYEIGPR